jgi:UDP:flavonoid glycosyltransferase YjiC (YdhE family)
LRQFLDGGEPPIVFTLGSAAVGTAGDFFRQSADWAQGLGRRAVLLVGRDPENVPAALPASVLAVPYAPHAAAFARARVVVHQGGIGTTAEVMRAGCPSLVVPYSHDQPDHARRMRRLGIARNLARESYHARSAAREIQKLLENPGYALRAAEIGRRVASENGVLNAADAIDELL